MLPQANGFFGSCHDTLGITFGSNIDTKCFQSDSNDMNYVYRADNYLWSSGADAKGNKYPLMISKGVSYTGNPRDFIPI